MSVIRQIAQLGAPVLRECALAVSHPQAADVAVLIDDMHATIFDANGAGLAAPQVYESLRIFLLTPRRAPRFPGAPEVKERRVLINPEILWRSPEVERGWEGCLSIPGMRGLVPRHLKIGARYINQEQKIVEEEFCNFDARVFQHEYDHLDGVLYLDRLESNRDLITEKEYVKLITPA